MLPANSTKELLLTYSNILRELKKRQVARSSNNPVGDLAETLFIRAFGLKLVKGSHKGFDAYDPKDEKNSRYQIKGRRLTAENPSRQLSQIRDLQSDHFDYLVGVLFDEDFKLLRACVIPVSSVRLLAKKQDWVNAWRLDLRDSLWKRPEVRDITIELSAEYDKL